MKSNIIIYDGECGFCNKMILYIAQKDTKNNFTFVSNLSTKGIEFIDSNDLVEISKKTIIVVFKNQHYTFGEAIKIIFSNIQINKMPQKIIQYTNTKLLNFVYNIIAKNRLFLSNNVCQIPPSEILSKFIIS